MNLDSCGEVLRLRGYAGAIPHNSRPLVQGGAVLPVLPLHCRCTTCTMHQTGPCGALKVATSRYMPQAGAAPDLH